MPVDYEISADLDQRLSSALLLDEFIALTQNGLTFKAILALTTDKNEDIVPCKGPRAKVVKVPPVWKMYVETSHALVVDGYSWNNNTPSFIDAAIHHALMSLEVKMSDSGKVTIAKRKPDICEFRRTVSRFGCWNDDVESFKALLERAGEAAAEMTTELLLSRRASAQQNELG